MPHSPKIPSATFQFLPPGFLAPSLPPTGNHQSALCYYRLDTFSRILYNQNYSMQSFSLSSLIQQNNLKFSHAFMGINSFFLFPVEQPSIIWICHNLLIHSSAGVNLGCSLLLIISYKATMNIWVHVFGIFHFFVDCINNQGWNG